jgi:hypothetical protein
LAAFTVRFDLKLALIWGGVLLASFVLSLQESYQAILPAFPMIILAIVVFLLATSDRTKVDIFTQAAVLLGWQSWLWSLNVAKPAVPQFLGPSTFLLIIVPFVIAVSLWRILAFGSNKLSIALLLAICIGGFSLYLLPFVLWTQGAIPFYNTAALYAIAFALAVLVAGKQYTRRFIVQV